MRIIPVIDLMNGQVVRGIAGRRHEYRPITSRLTAASDPLSVAHAFRKHFRFNELYLADLDALAGAPPALETFRALAAEGFRLWIDAGIRQPDDAGPLQAAGAERVIAGLETVAGPEALARLCRQFGKRITFSLDLKDGEAFASADAWKGSPPMDIARQAVDQGVTSMLVLDLRRVGGGQGTGTEDLCRRLTKAFPALELAAGGGVRGVGDLVRLASCGVQAALVASALHDGVIQPGQWRTHG